MATVAHSGHLPDLGEHRREQTGIELEGMLVELIDLSLLGKQLHWTIIGPNFRSLHLQLDELIDSWRLLADTVAERAVAIGYLPNGQRSSLSSSEISEVPVEEIRDHEVVTALTQRLAAVVERARERMDKLDELDAASQDVLVEVVRALEEQLWMIRVQGA